MPTLHLIDTCTLSFLVSKDPVPLAHLARLGADDRVYTCFVVVGEWEYGIQNIASGTKRTQLEREGSAVLGALAGIWQSTPEISLEYGTIHAHLRKTGMLIHSR